MKRTFAGLLVLSLVVFTGCTQGNPGGPGVTNPNSIGKGTLSGQADDTLVSAPAAVQTKKALDLVPQDTPGFILIKDLRQLSDQVENLANKLKAQELVSVLELIQPGQSQLPATGPPQPPAQSQMPKTTPVQPGQSQLPATGPPQPPAQSQMPKTTPVQPGQSQLPATGPLQPPAQSQMPKTTPVQPGQSQLPATGPLQPPAQSQMPKTTPVQPGQSQLPATGGGPGGAGTGAAGQTFGTAGPGAARQAPVSPLPATGPLQPPAQSQMPNTTPVQPGQSQLPATNPDGQTSSAFNPEPLLTNPLIGQHLELTNQQLKQLSQAQSQLMNTHDRQLQQLGNVTPGERNARIQALTNQFNSQFGTAANSIFTPAQQQRYQQLLLQQPGFPVFSQQNVQSRLNLTPDQISQLQARQANFNQQTQQIRNTQDPAKRQRLFEQLRDAQNDALRGVLNQNQLQTWNQMTGQPFDFTMEMNNQSSR